MLLTDGNYSCGSYRFGFQSQEMDNEIKGTGNSINFKYRMHDPRIGRFFAVDPIAAKFPHNSPYAFSENRVIDGIEYEGLEVILIGNHHSASVGGSGNYEYGIAINRRNGEVAGYMSFGIGGETNVSYGDGINVTYYPKMENIQDIKGSGVDVGGALNLPVASLGVGYSNTNGYSGIYIQAMKGWSSLLIDGSGYYTYTVMKKMKPSQNNLDKLQLASNLLNKYKSHLNKKRQKLLDKDELSTDEQEQLNKLDGQIDELNNIENSINENADKMSRELYGPDNDEDVEIESIDYGPVETKSDKTSTLGQGS